MANRYWVGGTANWDSTAGTKWATISGGSGGSAIPTSSDDVFFDANSGSVTITASGGTGVPVCHNFNTTGFTGTFTKLTQLDISGSMTLGSGMTWDASDLVNNNFSSSSSETITRNGVVLHSSFTWSGTGSWTFQDNFTTTNSVNFLKGTFNSNNNNFSFGGFTSSNTNVRTINMGSGTWTLGTNGWNTGTSTNLTLNSNTSTIKIVPPGSTNFQGGGQTYKYVWFSPGSGAFNLNIFGASTFSDFRDSGTGTHTLIFPNVTITTGTFHVRGTPGHLITLSRTGGSGTFTLSASTGIIACDYLSISNSTATGGATWYAGSHSTDGGGNTGWIFTDPPNTGNQAFLSLI